MQHNVNCATICNCIKAACAANSRHNQFLPYKLETDPGPAFVVVCVRRRAAFYNKTHNTNKNEDKALQLNTVMYAAIYASGIHTDIQPICIAACLVTWPGVRQVGAKALSCGFRAQILVIINICFDNRASYSTS